MEWTEVLEKIKERYWLIPKNKMWYFMGGFIGIIIASGWGLEAYKKIINPDIETIKKKSQAHLKTIDSIRMVSENGLNALPVGSIIAWHKNPISEDGKKLELNLPSGWAECDGNLINDSDSPLHYYKTPNLNTEGRFLRGAKKSGKLQPQSWRRLAIDSDKTPYSVAMHEKQVVPEVGFNKISVYGGSWGSAPHNGLKFSYEKGEIRPLNMSVVWIIKIK